RVLFRSREGGRMAQTLLAQLLAAAVGGQREDPVAVTVALEHVQRAQPDAAGRAQHRDPYHVRMRTHPNTSNRSRPTTNSGAAAVTLSMRSSTPPCPGSRCPLCFRPACRLNRLSVRSPTTEAATTATHSTMHGPTLTPGHAMPGTAMAPAAISPPATPPQVLPGLTCGASLRRPNRRPVK